MGEVLLCDFVGDDKIKPGLVVVKRTFPKHPNRDHQNAMMREEARVAVRLRHDNLVETFGIEEFPPGPLLVMEYLAGRSMAQVLGAAKRNQALLPPAICVEILRNSACGLHFAHTLRDGPHSLGLVHRDVSPANVFVTFDGRVKVIDFGVAKAEDSELRTSTGILKGKLGYMAPEHASGEKLDARADIWSLGVVFWESLAAQRLFKGNNPAMTLRQIASMEIPPPSTHNPDVPKSVDELCLALLERDRSRRVASGRELVDRLGAINEFMPGVANIGEFLQGRFPGEAHHGIAEAQRAARSNRRAPIPIGLVDGGGLVASGDETIDVNAATAILNKDDFKDLIEAASGPVPAAKDEDQDLPQTISMGAFDVGISETAPGAYEDPSMDTENKTATANIRPGAAPVSTPSQDNIPTVSSGGSRRAPGPSGPMPAAPPRQQSGPSPVSKSQPQPRKRRRRRGPSAVAFGLATFGVLSLFLGLIFAILTAQQKVPPTDVYLFYDANDDAVLVAHQEDVPAAHFKDRFKVPLTQRRDLPLTRKGPWIKPEPEKFKRALVESGLWADANMPHSRRDRLEVGLPALVAWLGLLSLGFAIPAFLMRGASAWIVRLILTFGLLGGGGFIAWRGGLGWPGLEILQSHDAGPTLLKLPSTFGSVEKPKPDVPTGGAKK
jgi:serine/threonine-protein kinase